MTDDDDSFVLALEVGQDLVVEEFLEHRILVGRPFVEQVDRTVFQVGGQESQALALALGKLKGGKAAFVDLDFVVEAKFLEVVSGLGVEVRGFEAEQAVEEVEVVEDDREELAYVIAVGDRSAVEEQVAGIGAVEPDEDLGQGGLAAAVAADDEERASRVSVKSTGPRMNVRSWSERW